jgi:anti-sigma regulatory factor (Ser/Thr protein kinase)
VTRYGAVAGLGEARTADLVLAVDEVATNSLRHGGGRGTLRIWREDGAVVCEVRDAGRIEDPMAGRERPAPDGDGGRGLWMVNQLCDLVQLRTLPTGAVVRLHLYVR